MHRIWIWALLAGGCGDDGGAGTTPGDSGSDGGSCPRPTATADRTRFVVVSHPYADASTRSNTWEVLELAPAGVLSRPGRTFQMGRAIVGEVAFTADGKVGIAPQDDGSLGVFTLDDAGTPTVVHAMYKGEFYAHKIVRGPDGTMYVLDDQWRENGGGIYELAIDCTGTVTSAPLLAAAKLPAGLAFMGDQDHNLAVLAANDIGASPAGAEGHVLDWAYREPTVESSTDLFPENDAIIGGTAIGFANPHFFVGDTSGFSSVPNSVAIANLAGNAFGGAVERVEIEDPLAILADPDHDQVLVVSGFGNAMFVVDRPVTTWRTREVTYMGQKPQLPGGAVMVDQGMLRGHTFVAENTGVRHVRFTATGVEDLGEFSLGMGIENSTGAIGVTP